MRVAITADWMSNVGGGGRVLSELKRLFPDAPIYTTICNPAALPEEMRDWDIRTSFLQRVPFASRRYQAFLPLMPMAFEQFDMRGYDLVISTSSACAKGVITPPDTLHVCYCYTPSRYLWDLYHDYVQGSARRFFAAPIAHWMRVWDRIASDRVDRFVAISGEVAGRIRRHYRRDAEVIYPPVDLDRVVPNGKPPEDFYLVVSRLVRYKRVDLAVRAATELGVRLVVVGRGPELPHLRAIAGPTVEFPGHLPDADVADLYARCRAFLFSAHEDFGIAPVEAQAAGRPVVAYARGGAAETVLHGVTGILYPEQTVESLIEGIQVLEGAELDGRACRLNAERFSAPRFRAELRSLIQRELADAAGPGARSPGPARLHAV
jgi:glycosyltransferase involved in cell wall biosynthesis